VNTRIAAAVRVTPNTSGRITEIDLIANPEKLAGVVPS
jgi:hypothetical protein